MKVEKIENFRKSNRKRFIIIQISNMRFKIRDVQNWVRIMKIRKGKSDFFFFFFENDYVLLDIFVTMSQKRNLIENKTLTMAKDASSKKSARNGIEIFGPPPLMFQRFAFDPSQSQIIQLDFI